MHGLVIGKFLPPHNGHKLLVDMASAMADELTVVVCAIDSEPIAGHLRYDWMRQTCPKAHVLLQDWPIPQEPHEHPDFWSIWRDTLRLHAPAGIDLVFGSDPYVARLAEELDARHVPVDPERTLVPVSGSAIRDDPMTNWDYLVPAARAHFAKRVCIFGPESTGKTTLARQLARHFDTVWVHEYGRVFLDTVDRDCTLDDIRLFARAQPATEDALAHQANRVLFCDTDPLTTVIWSRGLLGSCPDEVVGVAAQRRYDLTLLLDDDVPFVPDSQRYLPDRRQVDLATFREALDAHARPYCLISGDWDQRFRRAVLAVEDLVRPNRPDPVDVTL